MRSGLESWIYHDYQCDFGELTCGVSTSVKWKNARPIEFLRGFNRRYNHMVLPALKAPPPEDARVLPPRLAARIPGGTLSALARACSECLRVLHLRQLDSGAQTARCGWGSGPGRQTPSEQDSAPPHLPTLGASPPRKFPPPPLNHWGGHDPFMPGIGSRCSRGACSCILAFFGKKRAAASGSRAASANPREEGEGS